MGTERFSPDCLRLWGLPVIVLHRGLLLFHGFAKKLMYFWEKGLTGDGLSYSFRSRRKKQFHFMNFAKKFLKENGIKC